MAYYGVIPFTPAEGGTGVNNGTKTINLGSPTAGFVMTSDASGNGTWQLASGGSGITTISGDTGSVTGSTVSIKGASTAGNTVSFAGSGTAMTFNVTDSNFNTVIGNGAIFTTASFVEGTTIIGYGTGNINFNGRTNSSLGAISFRNATTGFANSSVGQNSFAGVLTGSNNSSVGQACFLVLTSGSNNSNCGAGSFDLLTTGSRNSGLGLGVFSQLITGSDNIGIGGLNTCGLNYTGAESSNILINNAGVTGESHVIRIGTQGTGTRQQSSFYAAGIAAATISAGSPLPYLTLTDASNGQIVSRVPASSDAASTAFGSIVVGTALQNTAPYPILVTISIAATVATGATIVSGVGITSTPTTNAITAAFSVATVTTFSQVVPSGFYLLVNTTGTITVGSTTTQVCQIG